MKNDVITKILAEHKDLLSLPQTLSEVLRVARDEKASAKELANVLMKDPALTAKVLRIVNSPFYGVGRVVGTMTQAVVTLGTRTVTALALSTSVYKISDQWKTSIDRIRFWRHSLEVAIAARLIAETSKYPHPEEAFVAGLLHDLGILILESAFADKYREVWKRAQKEGSLSEWEDEQFGTNHARVAQFLLEQWRIPQPVCEAVGHHHALFPPHEQGQEHALDQIVSLGNQISRFAIVERICKDPVETITSRQTLRDNLCLTQEQLTQIEQQLFSRTVEEARYLEMEVGTVDDLLAEANRLLFQQYMTVENLLCENRRMQQQIAKDQMKKLALESVKTITATINHYMNNATATILGRAQLVEYAIKSGQVRDVDGSLAMAMHVITGGVNTISAVMEELQNLASFETTVYHAETHIIDLENRLKKQLTKLQETVSSPSGRQPETVGT
ncbi:MAG: HDOD domain-containing protein [Candidatus Zixiibacteriota bacterium]